MKKSIICLLTLILAFAVPAFCQESVAKNAATKTTNVTTQAKSAVNTAKKDVATVEKKVATDAEKISTETKSAVDTTKKDVATAEKKVADEVNKVSAETKSAVDNTKKAVETAEEKTLTEAESVANAAKKDVATAEENVVKETKAAVDDVKNDIESEENKIQTEDKIKEETSKAVKAESEKSVAKNKDVAETSSEKRKIFNYSKDKSRTEIEIKVGTTLNAKPEIDREPVKVDNVYTVGIEVMAYSNSFIGFGAGIYNIFDSKIKDNDGNVISGPDGEYKVAFTNPYLTLKSKILQFDSDIIRNVYIFGQIGYGFMRIQNAYETEDGMYWGIGGGVDIWHFLIDVNYATNFGKIKTQSGADKMDVRQSTVILSLGYRFRL